MFISMEVVLIPDIWSRVKEDWECWDIAWLFVLMTLVDFKLAVIIVFIVVVVDDLGLVFPFMVPLSDARF